MESAQELTLTWAFPILDEISSSFVTLGSGVIPPVAASGLGSTRQILPRDVAVGILCVSIPRPPDQNHLHGEQLGGGLDCRG
jgi:hypothetical protein